MKKKEKKIKRTSIGGQAVLEGVMMSGKTAMATAVRDADGIVRIESKRKKPIEKRNIFLRLPIIRGVYSFIQSMVGGTAVLMRSAEVYGEGEPGKFEKWLSKTLKIDIMSVVSVVSLTLGLGLAILLFIYLPVTLSNLIQRLFGVTFNAWAKNFVEGGIKLAIFVSYISLTLLLKDIRRVFMYHGAEHKTISCYEKGLDLTVENARKCTRVHNRCGTTFIVFVMIISILVFACFESILQTNGISLSKWKRVLCKIGFLPIVAGLSYELLKGLAKTDCPLVFPLKVPGLLLQRLTTREPDDKMLEVAITAFKTVMEMDEDQTIKEVKFVTCEKTKDLTEKVKEKLTSNGVTEKAEAEWIVSLTLKIKRDEVYSEKMVSPKNVDKVMKLTEERCTGRPLWYCVGDTDFYGYTIKVNESVLIPRPETELLVEQAILTAKGKENPKILDLCTGSGCIAIALSKELNVEVDAVDVSEKALETASENAKINNAQVIFKKSDMFDSLDGEKYDIIVSNPPYIKSKDVEGLEREVKDFEPITALDGGEDGYDFYRIISNKVKEYLAPNGVVLLECGIGQAETVAEMFRNVGKTQIIKDYENIERIVKVVS